MLFVAIPYQSYGNIVGCKQDMLFVAIPDQYYGDIVAVNKTCCSLPYLTSPMGYSGL